MLIFFSSMLCTSKIHPFSLGNYLGTSTIIKNLGVEWLVFCSTQLATQVPNQTF